MEHSPDFCPGVIAFIFGCGLIVGSYIYYKHEMKDWSNDEGKTIIVISIVAIGGLFVLFGAYDVLSNLSIVLTGEPFPHPLGRR